MTVADWPMHDELSTIQTAVIHVECAPRSSPRRQVDHPLLMLKVFYESVLPSCSAGRCCIFLLDRFTCLGSGNLQVDRRKRQGPLRRSGRRPAKQHQNPRSCSGAACVASFAGRRWWRPAPCAVNATAQFGKEICACGADCGRATMQRPGRQDCSSPRWHQLGAPVPAVRERLPRHRLRMCAIPVQPAEQSVHLGSAGGN